MAPEVMMGEAYDERADVFSFGVVCNEIITGYDAKHFKRLVEDGYAQNRASKCSQALSSLCVDAVLPWTLSISIRLCLKTPLLVSCRSPWSAVVSRQQIGRT